MEARSFSQEKSQQLMRKVKEYKADLKKITEDSRQAQGAASGTCMPVIKAAFCLPLHQSHVHDRPARRLLSFYTHSLAFRTASLLSLAQSRRQSLLYGLLKRGAESGAYLIPTWQRLAQVQMNQLSGQSSQKV